MQLLDVPAGSRRCHPCLPHHVVAQDDGWTWDYHIDVPTRSQAAQRLVAYWEAKRAERDPVCRVQIDPVELSSLLPRLFMACFDPGRDDYVFTLIGTGITTLFGADRTGASLTDLHGVEGAAVMRGVYELSVARRDPVVLAGELHRRSPNAPNAPNAGPIAFDSVLLPVRDRHDRNWMIFGGLFADSRGVPPSRF